MTLRAVLANGSEVTLDQRHGDTLDEMTARLIADSLTGSAVPLADAKLTTTLGMVVSYSDVNTFIEDESYGSW